MQNSGASCGAGRRWGVRGVHLLQGLGQAGTPAAGRTLMPVTRISCSVLCSAKLGASLWMGISALAPARMVGFRIGAHQPRAGQPNSSGRPLPLSVAGCACLQLAAAQCSVWATAMHAGPQAASAPRGCCSRACRCGLRPKSRSGSPARLRWLPTPPGALTQRGAGGSSAKGRTNGADLVHGLADHVHDAAQRLRAHRHLRSSHTAGTCPQRYGRQRWGPAAGPGEAASTPHAGGVRAQARTLMGEPMLATPWPRVRPSVPSMAMQRTLFSPRCWATSSTRRRWWSCTSRAVEMGGRSPSKCTSTTAPITCPGAASALCGAWLRAGRAGGVGRRARAGGCGTPRPVRLCPEAAAGKQSVSQPSWLHHGPTHDKVPGQGRLGSICIALRHGGQAGGLPGRGPGQARPLTWETYPRPSLGAAAGSAAAAKQRLKASCPCRPLAARGSPAAASAIPADRAATLRHRACRARRRPRRAALLSVMVPTQPWPRPALLLCVLGLCGAEAALALLRAPRIAAGPQRGATSSQGTGSTGSPRRPIRCWAGTRSGAPARSAVST